MYRLTEKELNNLLKKIVILVDTREKNNHHIIDFFEAKKIPYKVKKLDLGDYSFMLPAGSFEGQVRDIYFDRKFVIERKANIDELAGNFKDDGVRIKTELAHLNKYNIKFIVMLEDINFDSNIRNEDSYRSEYKPASLYGRIMELEATYNTVIRPIQPAFIGAEIYNKFKYYARYYFKKLGGEIYDIQYSFVER